MSVLSCGLMALGLVLTSVLVRLRIEGPSVGLQHFYLGSVSDTFAGVIAFLSFVLITMPLRRVQARRAFHWTVLLSVYFGFTLLVVVGLHAARLINLPVTWPLLSELPDFFVMRAALNDGSVQSSVVKMAVVLTFGTVLGLSCLVLAERRRRLATWCVCFAGGGMLIGAVPGALIFGLDAGPTTNAVVSVTTSALRSLRPGTSSRSETLEHGGVGFRLERGTATRRNPLPTEVLERVSSRVGPRPDVLVYVLETGIFEAMPLCGHGGGSARLHHFNRLCEGGVFFARHFSPWSNSTKSIFALTSGVYPPPDNRSLTRVHPTARLPSLAASMKEAGYRTASFASVTETYDRMDEYLSAHGYDLVRGRDTLSLPVLWGNAFGDDKVLVQRYLEWLLSAETPALMLLLPSNTHWPGFAPSIVSENDDQRYAKALEYQDEIFGELLEALSRSGRLENTIVVVVPDHGSTFDLYGSEQVRRQAGTGQHHVPFIVSHPALRAAGTRAIFDLPSSHVDLTPTLLRLLNLPLPCGLQGVDLFSPELPERHVAFFRDFGIAELFLGMADNGVYWNVTHDTFEGYDLCQTLGLSRACEPLKDPEPFKATARLIRARQMLLFDWVLDRSREADNVFCRAQDILARPVSPGTPAP